jgi:O-antigen ligase
VAIGLLCRGAAAWPRDAVARTTLGALVLLVLATAATIPHAFARAPAVRETLKALEYALVFLVAWWAARERPEAPRVVGIGCAIAIVLVGFDALRDYLHPQSGMWIGNTQIVRLAGHLEGPNQLAAWIGLALPAAIVELAPWTALVLTLFGGALVALTLSRGGIAQTAIALFGAVLVRGVGRRLTIAAAVAAAAIALAGLAASSHSSASVHHVGSLKESVDAGGTGTRAILWRAALAMGRAHPLLGVGAGDFELALPDYGAPPHVRTQANSLYLEAWADGGIVLLLATLLAALVPPLVFVRARGAPFALVVGIVGFALALHGLVDDVTFFTKVGQLWWVLAGVAAASAGASSSSPSATPGTR